MDPTVNARVKQIAERALEDAGEHLLEHANRSVPHDDGDLERSGQVTRKDLTVAVSYDTPYATRQHETTHYRHPKKGRAKWLELTFNERSARIGGFLADAMRRGFGQ